MSKSAKTQEVKHAVAERKGQQKADINEQVDVVLGKNVEEPRVNRYERAIPFIMENPSIDKDTLAEQACTSVSTAGHCLTAWHAYSKALVEKGWLKIPEKTAVAKAKAPGLPGAKLVKKPETEKSPAPAPEPAESVDVAA